MIRSSTSRLLLAASLFAGAAIANAQQSTGTATAPAGAGDPGRDASAEARAGQAKMGDADAQQSANAQNPVPPASVNEQVKEADPETVCDTKAKKPTPACEATRNQQKQPKPK